MKQSLRLCFVLCVLGLSSLHAAIQTYGFGCITNNGGCGVASQLFVDVISSDQAVNTYTVGGTSVSAFTSDKVLFRFRNAGPASSFIADLYFDDGELLSIASVINGTGTSFTPGSASPGNLPGGNAINFNTTAGFLADADSPSSSNGVNAGEAVGILFNLRTGKTYSNVINALAMSLAQPGVDVTGGLRIGMHVQGIGTNGQISEGFVNTPEPGFYGLLTSGLAGLFFVTSRMRRKASEKSDSNA